MSGGVSPAPSTRIEQLAPELDAIVSPSAPIQALADGFGGPQGPAEGPLWWKEGRYLLFSDAQRHAREAHRPGLCRPARRRARRPRRHEGGRGGQRLLWEGGRDLDHESAGKKLGRIAHGAPATTNLAFGGDDWKTLYFTSRSHLGAVAVKIPGIPVPTAKR